MDVDGQRPDVNVFQYHFWCHSNVGGSKRSIEGGRHSQPAGSRGIVDIRTEVFEEELEGAGMKMHQQGSKKEAPQDQDTQIRPLAECT